MLVYWWSRGFMSLRVAPGHATKPHVRPHFMVSLLISVVDPHCIQCGFGSSIFGQCRSGSGSRGFYDQKLEKMYSWIFFFFFRSKGLRKGRPVNMRSLQKITSSTSEISSLLRLTFTLLDTDPDPADQNECGSIRKRIRIHNTHVNLYIWHTFTVHAECTNRATCPRGICIK